VLRFGHAGILYQDSFVMYDHQTQSLWVHVTGRAEHGPLKGKQLRFLPSTVTTWKHWKRSYPHTLVLPGHRRGGFMGTYNGLSRTRGLGLVVTVRFKGKLYPFAALQRHPVVNDFFSGEHLLIYYDAGSGTGTAWKRTAAGRTLSFKQAAVRDEGGGPLLEDEQTGSRWSWLTGEAVSGPLRGKRLPAVSYNPILNDRFTAFYPGGPVFGR
jgi:hypothetical protein